MLPKPLLLLLLLLLCSTIISAADLVETWSLPGGGVQPRVAVAADGTVHAAWLKGAPETSEVWYATRKPGAGGWTSAQRVDTGPGSAVALGMVRGVQIALGAKDQPHLLWPGSAKAKPRAPDDSTPVLYSRMIGTRFTPPINVVTIGTGLDGGGAIAADSSGAVWLLWHAMAGATDDAQRVALARHSVDGGATFGSERKLLSWKAGMCACCEMGAVDDGTGGVLALLRVATDNAERDQFLARIGPKVEAVQGQRLSPWKTPTCPMSTCTAVRVGKRVWLAWETEGQVSWCEMAGSEPGKRIDAPGNGANRKHPAIAVDAQGRLCLAWLEGSGWNRAGTLRWQVWGADGEPVGSTGDGGRLAVWNFAAVAARPGGGFIIIH